VFACNGGGGGGGGDGGGGRDWDMGTTENEIRTSYRSPDSACEPTIEN